MQVFQKEQVERALNQLPEMTKDGTLLLRPASFYDELDPVGLMGFCHFTGRYGLPTVELVDWLQDRIGGRRAIEIGSGCGDLARHLNVVPTDSKVMTRTDVKLFYEATGQVVTSYPDWVVQLDAMEAMAFYAPQVVVASWVTQLITEEDEYGTGSMYGVDEGALLRTGVPYIFISNEVVHGKKKIMALPHRTFKLPFLRSRAARPELNRVWI